MHRIPRLLVAGVGAGVGKTVTLLALAAAFKQRGLVVAGFTLGPDEHDGPVIAAATGRATHVLDPWLMGRQTLRRTFAQGSQGADIALVEGALGLFDGLSPTSDEGSTAELARWLELPTTLVLDGANLGGSVAAVARGFERFDPRVGLVGLMANRVDGADHAQSLGRALEAAGSAPLLGWLAETELVSYAGRGLGPGPRDRAWLDKQRMESLAVLAEACFDVDGLLARARAATPLPVLEGPSRAPRRARIAVAVDEAFDRYFRGRPGAPGGRRGGVGPLLASARQLAAPSGGSAPGGRCAGEFYRRAGR